MSRVLSNVFPSLAPVQRVSLQVAGPLTTSAVGLPAVRPSWVFVLLLAAGLGMAAPRAHAQALPPLRGEARQHVQRALEHYREEDYDLAIGEFQAAYDIDPQPALLFAMAQAERLRGQCDAAMGLYEWFLQTNPRARQAEAAQEQMQVCRDSLPPQASQPPAEAPAPEPEVSERPPAPSPTEAERPSPTPQTSRRAFYLDWTGDALVLGGLLTAAVGGVVWSGANSDVDAANSARDYGTFHDRAADASGAGLWQGLGIASIVLGTAAVGVGIVHYVFVGPTPIEQVRATASLDGFVLRGGF